MKKKMISALLAGAMIITSVIPGATAVETVKAGEADLPQAEYLFTFEGSSDAEKLQNKGTKGSSYSAAIEGEGSLIADGTNGIFDNANITDNLPREMQMVQRTT